MGLPWHPVKPVRGGRPLDDLYLRLEADPAWVCQAKLDGRRALWDGERLWSRQGNLLDLCEPMLALLEEHAPGVMLDGEYMTVKGTHRKEACFFPFDVPDHHRLPLQERWMHLIDVLAPMEGSGLVEPCPHDVSWGDVDRHGWEGVVFKRVNSRYERGIRPGKTVASWVKYRAEWL